jgi:hypothetical protein
MKIFYLFASALTLAAILLLSSCANQSAGNTTSHTSAATAATPAPQIYRAMQGTGERGGMRGMGMRGGY